MTIESDDIRLAMLRAVGGKTVKCARGSFVAVFGDAYAGIGEGQADVESSSPQLTARTSDVTRLKILKGDRLTIDGAYYTVIGHQADGTGITVLQVHQE